MSEWKTARLSEIADVRVSNLDKKSLPHEPAVKLCNYMDVYSNDYITSDLAFMEATAAPSQIERFKVQVGDVMITKDSETPEDIGIPAVVTEIIPDLVCGYHLALIKPDSKQVDGRYLAKQLGTSTTANYYARRAAGSTRYGLSNGTINDTPIPLVPVPQQRRIATILTTLDEEIEATEALIAKHQQIKAGLMHDLFTRGLWTQAELARGDHKGLPCEATAKEGHLRPTPEEAPGLYQDSPLGLIPKAWSYAPIADLGKVKGGKRLPAGTPFSETPTPYPYLRVTDMVDGRIDDTALAFVPDHIEPLIASYKIFKDDLYVTIAGTLGQFGRIPPHLDGAQLTENAARITEIDRQRVCLDFVCAFLRSDLMAPQKFRAYGLGAGVPKLALYQIEKFIVPLPPIDEQKAAESILAANRTNIAAETTHLAKLLQQKQGLMHDLLTGRVRVMGSHTKDSQ